MAHRADSRPAVDFERLIFRNDDAAAVRPDERGRSSAGAPGQEIKRRSPFRYTYVAELANDYIGYLPDRKGHELGGYQTWVGLHDIAEPGTGEAVMEECVKMLKELAK